MLKDCYILKRRRVEAVEHRGNTVYVGIAFCLVVNRVSSVRLVEHVYPAPPRAVHGGRLHSISRGTWPWNFACSPPQARRQASRRSWIYTPPLTPTISLSRSLASHFPHFPRSIYVITNPAMSSPPTRANSVSSSSRPSSPSPAKGSMRSRMMSGMRRASTGLSITKALSRSSSKASLKDSLKVSTDSPPARTSIGEARPGPSPVAESPASEEAANLAEIATKVVGPSPLANVVVTEPTPHPTPITVAPALDVGVTTSPEQLPSELPTQAPVHASEPFGFSDPILSTTTPEPAVVASPELIPQDVPPVVEEPAPLPEPAPEVPIVVPAAEPPVPGAVEDIRQDYFSFSDPVVAPVSKQPEPEPEPAPAFVEPVRPSTPPPQTSPARPATPPQTFSARSATPSLQAIPVVPAEDSYRAPDSSYVHIPADAATFAWGEEPVASKPSRASSREPLHHSLEPPPPGMQSGKVSSRASKSSMSSSYGQMLPEKRGRSGSVRWAFTRIVLLTRF